ncbi:MAG: hypothetical protein GC136_03715 [Alphaproteobacteria bacterium]|nr:hypothetical protein [Alphaproteobacteria bacterium]
MVDESEFGEGSMWELGVVCGDGKPEVSTGKVFTIGQAVETAYGNLAFVCGSSWHGETLWVQVNEFLTKGGTSLQIHASETLKILEDQKRYAGYAADGSMPPNVTFEKDSNGGFRMVVKCAWAPGI